MKKRPLLLILFALLTVFVLSRTYFALTDDFRLGNIMHEMPYRPEWEIIKTEEHEHLLTHALNQKYSYIGKGAQSYAFVSDDGEYVIKLFKFKHLKPSIFLDALGYLPPFRSYYENKVKRKERTLNGVFNGYRLAYEKHREEAGLYFIHLNPGFVFDKNVILRDKIGIEREVDLNQLVFVLQKKVLTSRTVIHALLEEKKAEEAIEKIYALFDLYMREYAKGIVDHDHGVLHNTGFIGNQPIHLDVGKMHAEETIKDKTLSFKDLSIIARRIQTRVHERYPDQSASLETGMNSYFLRVFGKPYDKTPVLKKR